MSTAPPSEACAGAPVVPGEPVAVTRGRQAAWTACACATYSCAVDAVAALETWERRHRSVFEEIHMVGRGASKRYYLYAGSAATCRDALREPDEIEATRRVNDELLDAEQRAADELCACADATCVARARERRGSLPEPIDLTADQEERSFAITAQSLQCLTRVK